MGHASRLNPNAHLGQAPARVRDAVGKVLEVGDEVLIVNPAQPMRVAEITPLMDPGAPAGMMVLVLVCKLQIAAPRDQAIDHLYVLRHQAEIGDGAIPEAPREDPRDEASE